MARDNFIGWTVQDKLELLRGLQEARISGQITHIETARGFVTEFDPQVNNTQILVELEYSIANGADYDANDPIQAACAANTRPGITRANYLR